MKIYVKLHSGTSGFIEIDKTINSDGGSEGQIFFSHDDALCVKLFHETSADENKIDKVKIMLDPKFDSLRNFSANNSTICWPIYTAHKTERGKAIGYIMPAITDSVPLDALFAQTNPIAKSATFEDRVFIAGLLALLVSQVHKFGAIVGDLNPANIRLKQVSTNHRWSLHLIDTDSFQIKNGRRTYTSDIGRDLYSSPHLLQRQQSSKSANNGWKGLKRTREDDEFALAIIIFQILLSAHPMKAKGGNITQNIAGRIFPYATAKDKLPKHAPAARYDVLPTRLRQMFSDTFKEVTTYRGRAWAIALHELEQHLKTDEFIRVFGGGSVPGPAPKRPKTPAAPERIISKVPGGKTTSVIKPKPKPAPKPTAQNLSTSSSQNDLVESALGFGKIILAISAIILTLFIIISMF